MSDREELAEVMRKCSAAAPLGTFKWEHMADAVLAAGWRKPAKPCDACTCDHPGTWFEFTCKCCNRGSAA
jgi:hypothetical protein